MKAEVRQQFVEYDPYGSSCTSERPVFTHHITDITKIDNIVIPPNFSQGDLKTHNYIETDHVRVPVYAPADMVLTTGSYYVVGPYRFDFQVSCDVTIRFAHVTEPIQELREVLPETPANDSRDQQVERQIRFKAGDLIGYTTGTSVAGNWDFGVYDATTKNKYATDGRYSFSQTYTTAVCPYDYFTPELRAAYAAKFNVRPNGGMQPDGLSFCQ